MQCTYARLPPSSIEACMHGPPSPCHSNTQHTAMRACVSKAGMGAHDVVMPAPVSSGTPLYGNDPKHACVARALAATTY